MRILYHHRTQAEDAQGIHICEMVNAFKALGHEVHIIALVKPSYAGIDANYKRVWRFFSHNIPPWLYEVLGFGYNLYGYLRLRRAIKTKQPDLIYERYALNSCCGVLAAKRSGIPLVLEVNAPLWHEQTKLGRLRFRRLARYFERWICSHATWTLRKRSCW
jgi:UDP-N-acetylglucosamine:LPS N-acetylglucosamine transferase